MVSATAGFAYGVVGADVHVFGDGTPVYLLHTWLPPQPPDDEWLRALPSRMLNAQHAVVEFTGRTDELAALHRWRQSGARLSVRWLHGPGGAGKSRLAAQFAAESTAQGWKVVTAVQGPGSVLPPAGSQDLRLGGKFGIVLIVDYADRWPLSHLTWLLSNALLHQVGVPARVLLLARSTNGWPAVRASLANHQADTSAQLLAPLPDAGERDQMFAVARDSFARRYGLAGPPSVTPPVPLDDPAMGLTLAVHMAALVAVDAWLREGPNPSDAAGLTVYLLDREHLYWTTLYGDGTHRLAPDGQPFRTPPQVMNQVAFTAALTGPVRDTAGPGVLDRLNLAARAGPDSASPQLTATQVLMDHAVCYPPEPDTTLTPFYPDRLAEDFLALTTPGHQADYPAQDWASDTAGRILRLADKDPAAGDLGRAITFLAAATDRWPHLGRRILYPMIRLEPVLALAGGSPALTALASITDPDVPTLEAIEAVLPYGSHIDLDVGIAVLVRRLTNLRLPCTNDPVKRAGLLHVLARRLQYAGDLEAALESANETVSIYQHLAADEPTAHRRALGDALTNLANLLWQLGRATEAISPIQQALAIQRDLVATAEADNSRIVTLAGTLDTTATVLALAGHQDAALAAAREAIDVQHRHELAPTLRWSLLNTYSQCLNRVGRRVEAFAPMRDAAVICRQLAQENPGEYLPSLSVALLNISLQYSEAGAYRDALEPARESVDIARELADVNPVAYRPMLGSALHMLAAVFDDLGERQNAVTTLREAVELRRELANEQPVTHLPGLADSLINLSGMLHVVRDPRTIECAHEAVVLYRQLAAADPQIHLGGLAAALNRYSSALSAAGREHDALNAIWESTRIRRQLSQRHPAVHLPHLVSSLQSLSIRLAALGRFAEALPPSQEATGILRGLARTEPNRFLPTLSATLYNLSNRLSALRRFSEALTAAQESTTIRRRLAANDPGLHLPALAMCLNQLGDRLATVGRLSEAATVTGESVTILRRLAQTDPAVHLPNLATSLGGMASRLAALGQPEPALAHSVEAVAIYRTLVQRNHAAYLPVLANMLTNLASDLAGLGRLTEALTVGEEAIAIRRHLAAANPEGQLPHLADDLYNHGIYLYQLGWWEPAMVAVDEAVRILRSQLPRDAERFRNPLLSALESLQVILTQSGRRRDARAIAREIGRLRSY
ncbi:tetratricopeptide repeat protein [Micromonospora sp. LOL_023]|uniref:tetratricopeptide repeat protein n=1 Tax=Micromonospora sp. LOL_023 TaxID=3345418 RepID=UPI003A845423